jgi:DNA polymerase I-like protein with 3'-5' exonuclease and polymerase domains
MRLSLDLETWSVDEMWTRGPEFVRLAGLGHREDHGMEIKTTIMIDKVASLVSHARPVIGHNLMGFDLPVLARWYGVDMHALVKTGRVRDTKIMAALADPPPARITAAQSERLYSLDTVGDKYLGERKHGDLKALAKEFGGFEKIPVDDPRFIEYLRGDVLITDELETVLPWTEYAQREHEVAAIAAQISMNGFKVDHDLLVARRTIVRDIKARRIKELQDQYGLPTHTKDGKKEAAAPQNMDAGREAIRKAFEDLGAPYMPTTPGGKPQTSVEAMDLMILHYGDLPGVTELAETVKDLAGQRVIYETVSDHLHSDGRVHPSIQFRQSSGRWSVTKPGMTVMGKRDGKHVERAIFVADPGELLVAFDLSQVDARAVAALSGDREYMKLFEPGRDIHTEVAVQVFGDASMREVAKRISHGWNYGMGPNKIVAQNPKIVTPEIAYAFENGMRERFPRLVEWKAEVDAIAASGALLDNGFGRMMRPNPERSFTQGPALMGQGAARDLMMTGLLNLPAEILPMLRVQVHDEIVLSIPEDAVEDVRRVVMDALQFEWRGIQILADSSPAAPDWAGCYEKGV